MKRSKQFKNIIIHSIKISFSDPRRFLLSTVGIIISSFLFVFLTLTTSFLNDLEFVKYKYFPKDAALVDGKFTYNSVKNLDRKIKYTLVTEPVDYLLEVNRANLKVTIKTLGVERNFLDFPILSNTTEESLEVSELIAGRTFEPMDYHLNNRVAIIAQSTAVLLFGEPYPVNRTIQLKETDQNRIVTYQIVGIIRDTQSNYEINSQLKRKDSMLTLTFFVPSQNILKRDGAMFNKMIIRTQYNPDTIEPHLRQNVDRIYTIYTYGKHYKEYLESKEIQENVILMISAVIMTISSLNIMIITLFSIKNRVYEIGIKKAIGASDSDITLQFIIEAIIIALVGGTIGVSIGIFSSYIIILNASFKVGSFLYHIHPLEIIFYLLFVLFFVLLFSIIPSFIAARYNIVKALRFE